MGGQRWKVVVDSATSRGVPVRHGQELSSQALAERLPPGAVVEETDLVGDCLLFKRLSGVGPMTGWVSVKNNCEDQLVKVATPAKRAKPATTAAVAVSPTEASVSAAAGGEAHLSRVASGAGWPDEGPGKTAEAGADDPLGGWARLAEHYAPVLVRPLVQLAAETVGGGDELPPVDELESASAETLMDLLGFPGDAAEDFAKMPRVRKRKIIAESKALLAMSHEKRQDALARIRKAWPKGPMPSFAHEDFGPEPLPKGCCFPLVRSLPLDDVAALPARGAPERGEAGARRRYAPAAVQKEFLRSLRCEIVCTSAPVACEPSAPSSDLCRLEVAGVNKEQLSGMVMARGQLRPEDLVAYFNHELKSRICLLDGDIAARLAVEDLTEVDYRGERYKNFKDFDGAGRPIALQGNHALLSLTKPGLVMDIHKEYLLAGSDIIRTNTLEGNGLALGRYKMHKLAYDINKAAAQLAKRAAAEVTKQDKKRPRLVAGVLGPPRQPGAPWGTLVLAYGEQVKGLVDGGADLLAIEAVTDTLTAKAAIYAVEEYFGRTKKKTLPLLIGAYVESGSGRTPGGSTIEAFSISVKHAKPLSVGFVSLSSPAEVKGLYKSLANLTLSWCHVCLGAASLSPDAFASGVADYAKEGLLNLVGGGVGALPAHIAAAARLLGEGRPRPLPALPRHPRLELAGLEACFVQQDEGCQVVGQRCTPMGSAEFKTRIDAFKATAHEGKLRGALEVCVAQCEQDVDILDFNLDSDSIDGKPCGGKGAMSKFMRMCAAEPKVAKVPFMLCSCEWDVIKEGLESLPGKCIVNGICLMLGEEEFLRIARECKRYGAALVVLAIGENGQADTYEDKVRLCQKSYRLLRSRLDFPAEDIIFDCQVMLLGVPENAGYAVNFINAVAEIKRTCPCVSFIGGISNISTLFRGLNKVRDALHSVFLYHAIRKGLNMVMVEAGALPRYTDIDTETRELCEEMVLNRSHDGDHLQRFMAHVTFASNQSTCLPLTRRLYGPEESLEEGAARGHSAEGLETQQGVLKKRKPSTPAEQKAHWRSSRCGVPCNATPLGPNDGAGLEDACRKEGVVDKDQLVGKILAKSAASPDDVAKYLNSEFRKRVCVLDAGMSGRINQESLSEADYRGTHFKDSSVKLQGNHEVLVLTKPDLILSIHKEFFTAGADICGTNTLNGCAIGQDAYRLEAAVYELNKAAAQLAKRAASEATAQDRHRPRFVAGVLGPTSSGLCSPPTGGDPSSRKVTWDELVEAYAEQVRGLVDGGIDLLAVARVSDTLNAKAAIYAIDEYFARTGKARLPLLISVIVDGDGRTLSGQALEAFLTSVRHARPLAVGIDSACTAEKMREVCRVLAGLSPSWCYILAEGGGSEVLAACTGERLVNLVGCGATAAHLAEAVKATVGATARELPRLKSNPPLLLCGLESYAARPEDGVQIVGQRCNMTGSAMFQGLIDAYRYTKKGNSWQAAVEVCIEQCDRGADILDFNFDSELVDGRWAMGKFMRVCATHPKVARVPFMLSSAMWPVIEEGLKHVQGKCIVNAISLVDGEQQFLRLARACLRHGAAIIVMALDKPGEFPRYPDKVRICQRSYRLLRAQLDFPAEDIIFDCNITPVDGGPGSAADFLEAIGEVKRTCPGVSFIGGLSNLSLAFRGLGLLRDAMHSVLLHHAARKGLNFVIAEPGRLPRYPDLESPTATLCEEMVLNDSRDGAHAQRLADFASFLRGAVAEGAPSDRALALALALPAQALPLALLPEPLKPSPSFRRPLETLVQATGTINASLFQTFGSKAHAANNFHRITMSVSLKRCVLFSSISAYMGQGGSGPIPGASSFLDGLALWERHQGLNGQPITVQWGAIGEIGLRRAIYGSRDVFAQFDLGQKLVGPADTQYLERVIMTGSQVPEFLGLAYLDQTWQNTLGGKNAGGGGLAGRSTFADM